MGWMREITEAGVGDFVAGLKWMGVLDKLLVCDATANSDIVLFFCSCCPSAIVSSMVLWWFSYISMIQFAAMFVHY